MGNQGWEGTTDWGQRQWRADKTQPPAKNQLEPDNLTAPSNGSLK